MPATTFVRSGDLSLAVREHSPRGEGRATVVLVHGFPDEQSTWDTLIAELPTDDWHVVTYDVRGAGSSDAPSSRAGYRTERLVDDLVAVLDAVEADRVHLVGHDWGSVQLWDAVTSPSLSDRIASYVSISGPSLDQFGRVMRRPRGRGKRVANQALHSWYVLAFQIPALPELAWRRFATRIGRSIEKREHLPRGHFGSRLANNAANGVNLYRANAFSRRPRRSRTDVPVLVVHPERDPFLTDVLLEGLDRMAPDLRVERIDAGHWAIVTHASDIAALVDAHVRAHA